MSTPRTFKLVLSSLLIASVAGAATTATVTLGGSVASTAEITSVTTGGASTLDLSSGQKIAKVADVSINTNNDQGLTLTATSGSLTKAGGVDIAFQVTTVEDAATAPVAGAFLIASGTSYTLATSAAGVAANDLYIMYSPGATQDPGAYAGSITLTVADN